MDLPLPADPSRLAWLAAGAVVLGVVVLFVYSFVGTFALGLFVYYAARPVQRRLRRRTTEARAAVATMALLVLPVLALLGYVALVAAGELAGLLGSTTVAEAVDVFAPAPNPTDRLLSDPVAFVAGVERVGVLRDVATRLAGRLATVSGAVLHLTLALSFAFFMYRDGSRLQSWFRAEVGGPDTAVYAFLGGVDRDLETVYFGNILTVAFVTALALVVYTLFGALTPLDLVAPTVLALLTGLATFVPLVVGKLVYVPVAGYLAVRAVQTDVSLAVPVAFLVVSFLLLDLLPQSVVRPYVSGRTLHTGLVLFSYILGTALFGWYGLFYGPFLLVVVVQFANVVLPDLLRRRAVGPETSNALAIGSEPSDDQSG